MQYDPFKPFLILGIRDTLISVHEVQSQSSFPPVEGSRLNLRYML